MIHRSTAEIHCRLRNACTVLCALASVIYAEKWIPSCGTALRFKACVRSSTPVVLFDQSSTKILFGY